MVRRRFSKCVGTYGGPSLSFNDTQIDSLDWARESIEECGSRETERVDEAALLSCRTGGDTPITCAGLVVGMEEEVAGESHRERWSNGGRGEVG